MERGVVDRGLKIDPLDYLVFQHVFGATDSRAMMRSLINSILARAGHDPIGEIEKISGEDAPLANSKGCFLERFDIRVIAGERVVELEPQLHSDELDIRLQCYGVQALVEHAKADKKSRKLPKTTMIMLYDGSPLPASKDEMVTTLRTYWNNGTESRPVKSPVDFVIVELRKIRKRYAMLTEEVLADEFTAWMYLLTKGYWSDLEVHIIAGKFPIMRDFARIYGIAMADSSFLRAYFDVGNALKEHKRFRSFVKRITGEAREQGIEQAIEAARAAGAKEKVIAAMRAALAANAPA